MRALVKGLGWMTLGFLGALGGISAYVTFGNLYYETEIKGESNNEAIEKLVNRADKGWKAL